MNVTLTNVEYAKLAAQAASQNPRQLTDQYAAQLIREGMEKV